MWRLLAMLAVAAIAVFGIAACGDEEGGGGGGGAAGGGSATSGEKGGSKAGGGTVKVGNVSSVSAFGGVFTGYQAGVKAYFDYYNSKGGIDGTKIDFIRVDDAGDPGKAAAGARKLTQQDKVVAFVGMSSFADAPVIKFLKAQKIPAIGGWATGSTWHRENSEFTFNNIEGPNTPYCPIWSSDLAKFKDVKKIAFIAQDFPAATQDADCRAAAATKLGLQVAGSRIDVAPDAADYRPPVQRAIKAGADAVYFSTGTDGQVKGILAGEQLGFEGKYISTQPSGVAPGIKSVADKLDGRVLTSAFSLLPGDDDAASEELKAWRAGMKQFAPKYASEITSISGWAAGRMFADSLKAAGPDSQALTDFWKKQNNYEFGGLQGPMNYTMGSLPQPCVTHLSFQGGDFARADGTAQPPEFNCGPVLDIKTGNVLAFNQYEDVLTPK